MIIDTQLNTEYESSSDFRDAFSKIMGAPPTRTESVVLNAAWIDTPPAPMIAIADEKGLYLLEFVGRRGLENEIKRLRKKFKAAIVPGETTILKSIRVELDNYFGGKSATFKTPLHIVGSSFQKTVWQALQAIPLNETRSYLDIAKTIGRPTACRAVAQANGSNSLAIIIPCHRVINSNGELGGYGGGVARKRWLLEHEKNFKK